MRTVECKIHREGERKYVCVHFVPPQPGLTNEHFMDIQVEVKHRGVSLSNGRYDGQIFFPVDAFPLIKQLIDEADHIEPVSAT